MAIGALGRTELSVSGRLRWHGPRGSIAELPECVEISGRKPGLRTALTFRRGPRVRRLNQSVTYEDHSSSARLRYGCLPLRDRPVGWSELTWPSSATRPVSTRRSPSRVSTTQTARTNLLSTLRRNPTCSWWKTVVPGRLRVPRTSTRQIERLRLCPASVRRRCTVYIGVTTLGES